MIKITNVWTGDFEGAIRGMRNPYESHEKSDSDVVYRLNKEDDCPYIESCFRDDCFYCDNFGIGEEDMTLCKKLIKAGSEHCKFLRMIHVQADVKAPRYWWAEMDKYKFVEANSSSTMHLITKRELTIDDFGNVNNGVKRVLQNSVIPTLNEWIWEYQTTTDNDQRTDILRSIKQLLPESYNQLRTIDTNYECLLSIYHQRKSHRLTEWREFCEWIEGLPYMKEFLA